MRPVGFNDPDPSSVIRDGNVPISMRRVEVIIGMKRPAGAAFKAYPFIVIGRFGLGVRWGVPDSAAEVLSRVLHDRCFD